MSDQGTQPPIQTPPYATATPGAPAVPPLPPPKTSSGFPTWAIILIILGGCCVFGFIPLGFFLPALAKAQEAARRASCMNNTRQLGLAFIQWAGDHDDNFPPTVAPDGTEIPGLDENGNLNANAQPARTAFAELLKQGYIIKTKVFICPSSKDQTPPDTFPTDFKEARLQDLILTESQCSYGWDITKKHSADPVCAILADKPRKVPGPEGTAENNSKNHGGEGQNVFYNDGHVKWCTTSKPDAGRDTDIYLEGSDKVNPWPKSAWDAKIIR
jgi:hypothetical protein